MPTWPDHVDSKRAGLTDAELLRIAHSEVQDGDDIELMRVAGLEALTVGEADERGIPEDERDLEHGVVIIDDEPRAFIQINPVLWADFQNAKDEEKRRAEAVERLGPRTPVPFWLAFAEPMPQAMLYGEPDEDTEFLEVPGIEDIPSWPDVDAETLRMLALNVLILTHPANLHPFTYMRGSLVRDLVERPIRPLTEWREAYSHLVIEQLGGAPDAMDEIAAIMSTERVAFWDALEMPEGFTPPPPNPHHGEADTFEGVRVLSELGFFEEHGLDPAMDAVALARYGERSLAAWRESDFAALVKSQPAPAA